MLLLLRLRKPTKLMLLALATRRRPVNLPPTRAVSVLNCPQSDISPLTARCLVSTELLAVAWFIRATDRWPILQTTLTRLMARAVKYTSNVSSQSFVFALLVRTGPRGIQRKKKMFRREQTHHEKEIRKVREERSSGLSLYGL